MKVPYANNATYLKNLGTTIVCIEAERPQVHLIEFGSLDDGGMGELTSNTR
jgi:hypothetical protein